MTAGYLPFSVEDIEIICNNTAFRPVWEYGVELNGRQKYQSSALAELKNRIGVFPNGKSKMDVKIKTLKFDIGHIWVFDPFEKIWIKVPNIRPEYALGLTLYQHGIVQRYAKQMYKDSDDYRVLIEAKELMRQEVAALSISRSLSNRERAAKITGKNTRQMTKKEKKPLSASTDSNDDYSMLTFGDIFLSPDDSLAESNISVDREADFLSDSDDDYECVPNKFYLGAKN